MDGIKSRSRVQEHGEVFTPDSIVNDMIDLVDSELNKENLWGYIDKTWLEPACGNGNFLIRILDRKLEAVQKLPKEQWVIGLLHSVSTIYGVDIQYDNVEESKERMLQLIKEGSVEVLELPDKKKQEFHFEKFTLDDELEGVIKSILNKNIQQGDALTGKKWDKFKESNQDDSLLITEYIWKGEEVALNEIPLNHLQESSVMFNVPVMSYPSKHYSELKQSENKTRRQRNKNRQVTEEVDDF